MFKSMLFKAISLALMLSMICIVFAGCYGSVETSDTLNTEKSTAATPPADTTPPVPEEEPVEGGIDLTEYCIVRSKDASSDVRTAATIFKNFLSVYCGVETEIKTDDKAATEKEILFGMTNRAESSAAIQKVENTGWSIELVGDKIVLCAGTNSDIVHTTNYLVEHCLKKNSRYIVLGETPILSNDISAANTLTLSMDGTQLKYIKVALLADTNGAYLDNVGFVEAALLLADNIRISSAVTPTVSAYAADASYFQILVTSAKNGSAYLPSGVTIGNMQYAICRKGNSMVIVANDAMGAEMGTQLIIQSMQNAGKGNLELNALCQGVALSYTYGSNLNLEKDAEYRIEVNPI